MCCCCEKGKFLKMANKVGLFFVAMAILCGLWYYIMPVEKDLHFKLWQMSFLGFTGLNFLSVILVLIQSYIWGYIVVGVWHLVNMCCCKCEKEKPPKM